MRVDFHSHVLPGVDDGSRSVGESLTMLRMAYDQGITHVVATPHFYAGRDNPQHFLRKRDRAEKLLRDAMENECNMPQLLVGAEVRYFSGISESEAVRQLTIAGKDYILIEMPAAPWTDRMYHELSQLREKQGVTPIVAHIDRYMSPFRNRGLPDRLSRCPVLVQANAGFFLSAFTAPMALRLLEQERIHLLGSDCHDLDERPPRMGEAIRVIRRKSGDGAIRRMDELASSILFG